MKKIWKRVTSIVISCAIAVGVLGNNMAIAAENKKKVIEEKSSELHRIIEECEKVDIVGSSKTIKRGQIAALSEVSDMVGNNYTYMAIMMNGDLYSWGRNNHGEVGNGSTEVQLTPVKILSNVKTATYSAGYSSSGAYTVSAITENGDLYSWGYNTYGQVGNGSTKNQLTPVKILSDVKTVTSHNLSSVVLYTVSAITESGDLYSWGRNNHGQVGNGNTENQLTPVKILSNVKNVTYSFLEFNNSSYTVSAIMESGELYSWGYNNHGQVGNGSTKDQLTPVKILSDVKTVTYTPATYGTSSLTMSAITESGELYSWGDNKYGQVGNGNTENQLTPVKILSNVKAATYPSDRAMLAITESGELYSWGYNSSGQVGNGNTENQLTPVKILSNVKTVTHSFFEYNTFCYTVSAITESGELYSWGYNACGQVGNGNTEYRQLAPVKILSNVKTVTYTPASTRSYSSSEPFYTVLAITENGELYSWGDNNYGQVGNGSTKSQRTPVKILNNVKTVTSYESSSDFSACVVSAIMENGELYSWGYNKYGQIGNGSTEKQLTPIKILNNVKKVIYHTNQDCVSAITGNGELYNWGYNSSGQIGNGNTENQLTPIRILPAQTENNSLIVKAVEKYSTDNETLKKMLFYIQEQNLPYDVKMQLMNDVCMQYGYTDAKEGIEYLNDASSAQVAYNALVNNEQYCCWNFGYYLNNTTKGKIAKGLLYADGLIFNDELGAWLEPGTYIENDYPGIKKYKTLLAKFIEDSASECEIYTRASQVAGTVNDMLKLKEIDDAAELEKNIERLFVAASSKEQEKIINDIFQKDKLTVVDGKYITVKSETWGKAFGLASKTLKVATDGTNDILAFFDVSTRMKLYQEYDLFFEEIIHAEELPFELRAAAYFLQDEVKSGYFTPIKNLLLHSLKNASALQNSIQEVKIEKGELDNLLGEASLTIEIGAFCVNLLVDMGGLVKNAAYTNGYAYLTAFYANLLEESRAKFNNNKTEANAWDFYYKYNMLYRLRIAGEETYLELNELSPNGIMGWGGYLLKYAFDYDSKKSLVESNVSFLKEHCKFQLPNAITVPETYQFAQKAIVSCPVDVKVLDSTGTVIAVIADGRASDISNEYGRFMSVYKPYSNDYVKVIYLKDNGDYTYQIIGKNDGVVSLQMFEGGDTVSGFRNVAIDEKTIIKATTDNTVTTYEIDSNADGKTDRQEELQQEKDKMNILSSLSISDTECNLHINESKQLSYQYEPLNAVNSQVSWKIEDTSIASITQNGEVKALHAGTTTAYCISTSVDEKGDNIIASCTIIVKDSTGDRPSEVIPSESPNPPATTTQPSIMPSNTPSVSYGPTITNNPNATNSPTVTNNPNVTHKPAVTSHPSVTNNPTVTKSPDVTHEPAVTNRPSVTQMPTATLQPMASPVISPTAVPAQTNTLAPDSTIEPTETPSVTLKPSDNTSPTATPTSENNNASVKKLKKGSKVTDKKTTAVYKITRIGKNRTAEYVKSIRKNPTSISVPTSVKLKGKTYKVTSVGKAAFKNNKKLKKVKLGKNVKKIGKQTFYGCTNLTKVTLGKNIAVIGVEAFSKCTSLTIITIPSKVKRIGNKAFYKCKNLRYIFVKTKKLTAKTVGNNAFGKGANKLRVKTDKSKWKFYAQIFMAKGMSKKALFIINPVKLVI